MSYLSRTFLRRTGIRAFNLRRAIFTLHAFMLEKMGVFRLLHIMSMLCEEYRPIQIAISGKLHHKLTQK